MKKQDLIDAIPLVTLLVAIIYCLIIVNTTNTIISTKHYLAFILVGLSVILFFTNRKYYELIIGMITLAGVFGFIHFLPAIYSISIVGINFQSFPLFTFILLLIITYNKYKKVI